MSSTTTKRLYIAGFDPWQAPLAEKRVPIVLLVLISLCSPALAAGGEALSKADSAMYLKSMKNMFEQMRPLLSADLDPLDLPEEKKHAAMSKFIDDFANCQLVAFRKFPKEYQDFQLNGLKEGQSMEEVRARFMQHFQSGFKNNDPVALAFQENAQAIFKELNDCSHAASNKHISPLMQ